MTGLIGTALATANTHYESAHVCGPQVLAQSSTSCGASSQRVRSKWAAMRLLIPAPTAAMLVVLVGLSLALTTRPRRPILARSSIETFLMIIIWGSK